MTLPRVAATLQKVFNSYAQQEQRRPTDNAAAHTMQIRPIESSLCPECLCKVLLQWNPPTAAEDAGNHHVHNAYQI